MNDTVTIESKCPFCGQTERITVSTIDYEDWTGGKVAQDAFPYLNQMERETIISGICPDCQAKIFGV